MVSAVRTDDWTGFVTIGSRRLYASVAGTGPAVVLCSAGTVRGVGNWHGIESTLARSARVVTYDRAGTGLSDPPPAAPTANDMANDLHDLLGILDVPLPAVLVGSSLSALLVQIYACRHAGAVSGLLLLDPTPDSWLIDALPGEPHATPHVELARIAESCKELQRNLHTNGLPNVPVTVLSVERPLCPSITRSHQLITERSRGRLVTMGNTTHLAFLLDHADTIVTAVCEMLQAIAP